MVQSANSRDIDESILGYRTNLRVPRLKGGSLETVVFHTSGGPRTAPFVAAGGYARVFRLTDTGGVERAVRCFYSSPAADAQQRYATIDQYFRSELADITAEFSFHPDGIWIKPQTGGPPFSMPIIEMEWVRGTTLTEHIDDLVRHKKYAELRMLPVRWVKLIQRMRSADMAHGDLSGENVMVRKEDGSLVLIDYDGVYLTPFKNNPGVVAGNRAYQHPDFSNRPYDETMDNFPALLIYVALLGLAAQPGLWLQYSDHKTEKGKEILVSDTLLFNELDLSDIEHSAIYADLRKINDAELQKFLAALATATKGPIGRVPDFLSFFKTPQQALDILKKAIQQGDDNEIVRLADQPELTGYGPAQAPEILQAVALARELVKVKAGVLLAEETAIQVWKTRGFNQTPVGHTFEPRLAPFRKRAEQLQVLRAAKTDEELDKAWDDTLFAQYPPATAFWPKVDTARKNIEQALTAPLRRAASQGLQDAVARGDDTAILKALQDPYLIPTDPNRSHPSVRRAQQRMEIQQQIDSGLAAHDEEGDKHAIVAWNKGRDPQQGIGFPSSGLAGNRKAEIDSALDRLRRIRELRVAEKAGSSTLDRELLKLWDEKLFNGYRGVEMYERRFSALERQRQQEAQQKQQTESQFAPMRTAIRDKNHAEVLRLWELIQHLPGASQFERAVNASHTYLQTHVFDQLRQAFSAHPRDDRALIAAWNTPGLDKNDSKVKAYESRVIEAQQRVTSLGPLEAMLDDESKEDLVLDEWKTQGFETDPAAAHLKSKVEAIRQRKRVLNDVKEAIDRGDDARLLLAWDPNVLLTYKKAAQYRSNLDTARARLGTLDKLRLALSNRDVELAIAIWDKTNLLDPKQPEAAAAATYEPDVRSLKLRWLAARSLRFPVGRLDKGTLELRWSWPAELSWVGVAIWLDRYPTEFKARGSGQWTFRCQRYIYERDGKFVQQLQLSPAPLRAYVRLFPIIEHKGAVGPWLSNPQIAAVQLEVRADHKVSYSVIRGQDGKRTIRVDSRDLTNMPTLRLLVKANQPPTNADDGTKLGEIGSRDHKQGNIYEREFDNIKRWQSKFFLGVFPDKPEDRQWLTAESETGSPEELP